MSGEPTQPIDDVPTLTGALRIAAIAGFCLVMAAAIVLRFVTKSALWLDEALTVDIARLPLAQIPGALKHDGAPPLYYILLHFWMRPFGQSNLATRSLAGIFGVLSLVVAYFAGRELAGRTVAWTTVVLVASAPFAVYYSTEARMYSLVILLSGCGMVALLRATRSPRPANLIALAATVGALLYSQYWALYLVAASGLWLAIQMAHRRFRSPDPESWKNLAPAFIAMVVGCLTFLPWVPTFLYQAAHTGTPWAIPTGFGSILNMVTGFTFNQGTTANIPTVWGRVLVLAYFGFSGLALFGIGRSTWIVELDWRTRPRARSTSFVVGVTLLLAIIGGVLAASAFSPRYASVIFLPLIALVALGTTRFLNPTARLAMVVITVAAGLYGSVQNVNTQRTQATDVAAVLNTEARPGDIVALCPDQLGPSVYRLTKQSRRLDMITFPRGTGPAIVDWVDYAKVVRAANPITFAQHLVEQAGAHRHIWVVWEPNYQTFGTKCETLLSAIQERPGMVTRNWVTSSVNQFYEPMNLTEVTAPGP
ncbi:MAG: glycosyltransferase family 39 protein [Acidimicrobiales bacterium]